MEQKVEAGWKTVDIPTHPQTDGRWVEVIAQIRSNLTGEVRQYVSHEILNNGAEHPSTFNWAENNYSCDCNRRLFFERALGGHKAAFDEDVECSDGNFSVRLVNPVTGECYYKEFD